MNKIAKWTLRGLLAAAVVSGTYLTGGEKGFPIIYSHKTKDAYGINVAVYTKVDSGASINGLNLSLRTDNAGQINGANISAVNLSNRSSVNGLEAGLINVRDDKPEFGSINGVAIGIVGSGYKTMNGLQIGLLASAADVAANGVQVGLVCRANNDYNFLLNAGFHGGSDDYAPKK